VSPVPSTVNEAKDGISDILSAHLMETTIYASVTLRAKKYGFDVYGNRILVFALAVARGYSVASGKLLNEPIHVTARRNFEGVLQYSCPCIASKETRKFGVNPEGRAGSCHHVGRLAAILEESVCLPIFYLANGFDYDVR
jgi:hypothetical protein